MVSILSGWSFVYLIDFYGPSSFTLLHLKLSLSGVTSESSLDEPDVSSNSFLTFNTLSAFASLSSKHLNFFKRDALFFACLLISGRCAFWLFSYFSDECFYIKLGRHVYYSVSSLSWDSASCFFNICSYILIS